MATLGLRGTRLLRRLLSYSCSILEHWLCMRLTEILHRITHVPLQPPHLHSVSLLQDSNILLVHHILTRSRAARKATLNPFMECCSLQTEILASSDSPTCSLSIEMESLILLPWYSSGVRGTPLCNSVNLRPQWRTNVRTHTNH